MDFIKFLNGLVHGKEIYLVVEDLEGKIARMRGRGMWCYVQCEIGASTKD